MAPTCWVTKSTYGNVGILPAVTKDFPVSSQFLSYDFLSRCKFSTLTTRQPMVDLLTHVLTPSVTEERSQILVLTRAELTTSALASVRCYPLDYLSDERTL